MPVKEIILLRHGYRLAWTFDPFTQSYTSTYPYPTQLPADPPLADHGVRQSHETAAHLSVLLSATIRGDRLRVYSSPFYRCLETLRPSVEAFRKLGWQGKVRGETGLGEWFGSASFTQPAPGDWKFLTRFFPWLDAREPRLVPARHGESIDALHERVATALEMIVSEVDQEYHEQARGGEDVVVLICGHAAGIIASGRALSGEVPDDYAEEDFRCFTCGLSRFVRREQKEQLRVACDQELSSELAKGSLSSRGVAGGWDCLLNSNCDHLSQGEERGWRFHGDESFDSHGPPQAQGPGIEMDQQKKTLENIEANLDGSKL